MNWLNKIKPTKGDAYIKGNALPESDYETATGRALYTIAAMRKAYDAGQRDERKAQPVQPSQARDAERYQWLREQDWFSSDLCVLRKPKEVLTKGIGLGADCPSHFRLDAAIDAAINAKGAV